MVNKAAPYGAQEHPLNPILLALSYDSSFVALLRGQGQRNDRGLHPGTPASGVLLIQVLSPCVTYYNTYDHYREVTQALPEGHDPSDRLAAMALALETETQYLGIFYRDASRRVTLHALSRSGPGHRRPRSTRSSQASSGNMADTRPDFRPIASIDGTLLPDSVLTSRARSRYSGSCRIWAWRSPSSLASTPGWFDVGLPRSAPGPTPSASTGSSPGAGPVPGQLIDPNVARGCGADPRARYIPPCVW